MMDKAKRISDEEVGEMEEDQERQHRECLDELTEMLPFYRLDNTAVQTAQQAEEGEETKGGHGERQQGTSPLFVITNAMGDIEGEEKNAGKRGGRQSDGEDSRHGGGKFPT